MKWYITWIRPNMKALGGAVWPIMALRKKDMPDTIRHEEVHLKDQLHMLVIPWLVLYGAFHLLYGYRNNPFEAHAYAVEDGREFKPFGWINFL